MPSRFLIVMRGYDREQVDQLVAAAEKALRSGEQPVRDVALSALRGARFRLKVRGYSRPQVDSYIELRILELSRPL